MLFNELYYLADGGTLWEAVSGRFACLECFDYLFYETLDVRYYGAFPLAYFWPEIEKATMRGFARAVNQEDRTQVSYNKGMDIRVTRNPSQGAETLRGADYSWAGPLGPRGKRRPIRPITVSVNKKAPVRMIWVLLLRTCSIRPMPISGRIPIAGRT